MKDSYETPLITRITICFSVIMLLFSAIVIKNMEEIQNEVHEKPATNIYIVRPQDNSREPFADDPKYYKEAEAPHVLTEQDNINLRISELCRSYNMDEQIVRKLIQTESEWNPGAIDSTGEFVGLMQLSKRWQTDRAERLGVTDLMDPYSNILVGIDLLAYTLKETNGDYAWTLMIYNEGYQSAYQKHQQGIVSDYARTIMQV